MVPVSLLQSTTFLYEPIYRCHLINSGLSDEGASIPFGENDNCVDNYEINGRKSWD